MISKWKSHHITNISLTLSKLGVQPTKAAFLQKQLIKRAGTWLVRFYKMCESACIISHLLFQNFSALSGFVVPFQALVQGVGFVITPGSHSWTLPSVLGHSLEEKSHLFSRFASSGWSQKDNLRWWSWSWWHMEIWKATFALWDLMPRYRQERGSTCVTG